MTNNDILRRVRFIYDYGDSKMMSLFEHGGETVTRAEVSDWLKKDDDPAWQQLYDKQMAAFLNGFIIEFRGKKDDVQPVPEKRLNNNIILRKFKIALNLRDDDMIEFIGLGGKEISKHELSAFFRNPKQSQFRPCKDQVLRCFMKGLEIKTASSSL